MLGLGRMGGNMARRLLQGGHDVVVHTRSQEKLAEFEREGATAALSLEEVVARLAPPRIIWLMLPAGEITENTLGQLQKLCSPGDILVEGGNSYYKDDIRRAGLLAQLGLEYMDMGVSGGIWGLSKGYCLMAGGKAAVFQQLEPILKTLAPPQGYLLCGPHGAGHYVKMVHNGIEYAMMEAFGEGFEILRASTYGERLELDKIAHLWNQGSVVRSWLLELLGNALVQDPRLEKIAGYVEDSGEGRWTVMEAVENGVAADGIAHAVFKRFLSRQADAFSNKVLAALRNQFGAHAVAQANQAPRAASAGAGSVAPARADQNHDVPR
jgi:6-phosphogluconate dehydrogenase